MHRLYVFAILYKGLEYPQILVSAEGPGTTPPWIQRDCYMCGEKEKG